MLATRGPMRERKRNCVIISIANIVKDNGKRQNISAHLRFILIVKKRNLRKKFVSTLFSFIFFLIEI